MAEALESHRVPWSGVLAPVCMCCMCVLEAVLCGTVGVHPVVPSLVEGSQDPSQAETVRLCSWAVGVAAPWPPPWESYLVKGSGSIRAKWPETVAQ